MDDARRRVKLANLNHLREEIVAQDRLLEEVARKSADWQGASDEVMATLRGLFDELRKALPRKQVALRQLQQKAEVFDILQRHARQKMPACPNRNVSATPKHFCDFLIWNSPDPQFSTASHPQARNARTTTPFATSLTGIARSHGSLSTGPSSLATASIWNRSATLHRPNDRRPLARKPVTFQFRRGQLR